MLPLLFGHRPGTLPLRLPTRSAHLGALSPLDTRCPVVSAQPARQLLRHSSASPGISTCASLSSRSIARPDPTNPADRAVGLSPSFAALDNTLVQRPRLPWLSRRLPASRAHLVALAFLDMRRPFVSAQPACKLFSHRCPYSCVRQRCHPQPRRRARSADQFRECTLASQWALRFPPC
jgi:hypothetical protein